MFLFPALIIFLLLRAFTRLSGPHRREELDTEDPYDLLHEGEESGNRNHRLRVAVFKLAYKLEGSITVSDIVVELGLDASEAEELIQSMVDNQRIRMEVQEDGLVVYEFPEFLRRFKGSGKKAE
jgi:hypothetical protein